MGPILYGCDVTGFSIKLLQTHSYELHNDKKNLFLPLNASDVNKSQAFLLPFYVFLSP
jgi:hypothetical protein